MFASATLALDGTDSGRVRIAQRFPVGGAHPSMIILESSVLLQINPFLPAVRTFFAVASFHEKSAHQEAPGSTQWLRLISYPSTFVPESDSAGGTLDPRRFAVLSSVEPLHTISRKLSVIIDVRPYVSPPSIR